jgi:cytochrome c
VKTEERMKHTMVTVLLAAGFALSPMAQAQPGEDFAKSKCSICHAVDQKKVGPSFKEISAKSKSDKGAEARLIAKLKEAKTHPRVQASDAELKSAVQYVLKQ